VNVRTIFGSALWCLVVVSMTACSQSKSSSSAGDAQSTSASKTASAADSCNKQVEVKLNPVGGRLKLPTCAGYDITLQYPAAAERGAQTATIGIATTNVNNIPPPPNYGTPFLFMSISSNASLRDTAAMRMTFSHARDKKWNPDHRYTYSRYEGGEGPFAAQGFDFPFCEAKVCSATMVSPLAGSFSASSRVDYQFVRDPGVVNSDASPKP
jgi:hypothetical protein